MTRAAANAANFALDISLSPSCDEESFFSGGRVRAPVQLRDASVIPMLTDRSGGEACGIHSVFKRSHVHVAAAVFLGLIDRNYHCRHQVNARENVRLEFLAQTSGLRRVAATQKSHPDVEGVVAKNEHGTALLERGD